MACSISCAARGLVSGQRHESIGLIAGAGRLPILVAEGMKEAGRRVCAVGLRGQFDAALPPLCDAFSVVGIARLGSWIRVLRRFEVTEAIMVGRVEKGRAHERLKFLRLMPDVRSAMLWYRKLRHDHRNATVLTAIADELRSEGITLIDSTTFIAEQMATPGVMGRVQPTPQQQGDVAFGWPLLGQIAAIDVGQSIAVRERDVVAVEAVEGTDAMIERAGQLCSARGWSLLKTAKPQHDMRADVPTIGVATVERVARCGGRCIAVGVGRVILLDKPLVIEAADRLGVALLGVE